MALKSLLTSKQSLSTIQSKISFKVRSFNLVGLKQENAYKTLKTRFGIIKKICD